MLRSQLRFLLTLLFASTLVLWGSQLAYAQQDEDEIASPECNCGHVKPPAIAGSYSGTIEDPAQGRGTMVLVIAQTGKKITGQWGISFPGEPGTGGNFKGKVSKHAIHLKANTGTKGCRYHIDATIYLGALQGNYFNYGRCPEDDSGNFQVQLP